MTVNEAATEPSLDGRPKDGVAPRSRGYRPALDGLRGIAVLAVFIYHASPGSLRGGWLGVDLFFVLSGFLITRLLLTEYHSWGWVSFTNFWQARARRLLPAVVLVVGSVLVAACFWTPVGRRGATAGDAIATLGYVANWRLILTDEAYFAAVASPSPLRHAWSLAVEEQYYVLFPLLLVALLKIFGRRWLPMIFALMAVASAAWMAHLYVPGLDPSRVYYGTDTRVHELLVGAIAAAILAPGSSAARKLRLGVDRWSRRLAPVALLAIVISLALVSDGDDLVFQGGLVAFAVLASTVVVTAASPNASPLQRALSFEPLRLLGVISYGVYLWHWPVIVFASSSGLGSPGPVLVIAEAAVTLGLAIASYRWVENPIRRRGWTALVPGQKRLSLFAVAGAVAAVMGLVVVLPRVTGPMISSAGGGVEVSTSDYRPGPSPRNVVLVGNSVPHSLFVGFPRQRFPDLQVNPVTNFGCDALDDPKIVNDEVVPATADCKAWRSSWTDSLAALSPDLGLVFISHSMLNDIEVKGSRLVAGSPEHDAYLKDQWTSMLGETRSAGSRSVAFVNLACHRLPDMGASTEITRANDDAAVKHLNSVVASWGQEKSVPVIDQFGFLCSGGYHDSINGVPLYEDGLHFSADSSAAFWAWLAPQLQRIMESDQGAN